MDGFARGSDFRALATSTVGSVTTCFVYILVHMRNFQRRGEHRMKQAITDGSRETNSEVSARETKNFRV